MLSVAIADGIQACSQHRIITYRIEAKATSDEFLVKVLIVMVKISRILQSVVPFSLTRKK